MADTDSSGGSGGRLGGLVKRVGQQLKEAVGGAKRTELPPDFVAEDEAVRAARSLTEAFKTALQEYAEWLAPSGDAEAPAARLGEAATALTKVLPEDSVYRVELALLAAAAVDGAALDARLAKDLGLNVTAGLKLWLRGTGNDFARERRRLSERRLEMDAARGAGPEKRRFEEQQAVVQALMERVPEELEDHRRLARAALRLHLAHAKAHVALLEKAVAKLDKTRAK